MLTVCSSTPDAPAPTPTAHPVFSQKLDRQIFLALRRTQQAGNAAFTQTITFASKKGRAVQTLSGRLDFAQGAVVTMPKRKLSPGLSKAVRDTALGLIPGRSRRSRPSARPVAGHRAMSLPAA